MDTYYVYGLIDPTTSEYFYVGLSKNPERRLAQHISGKTWTSQALKDKVLQIISADKTPDIAILEETTRESAGERENHWMDLLGSQGHPLVNKQRNARSSVNLKNTLTNDERRALVLRALHRQPVRMLAQDYGITRQHAHLLIKQSLDNADEKLDELREEAAFLAEVSRLKREYFRSKYFDSKNPAKATGG